LKSEKFFTQTKNAALGRRLSGAERHTTSHSDTKYRKNISSPKANTILAAI
jgi:hypothetical protein